MDKKLIFLDIDGTLIFAMQPPSALAVEAVRGARNNGHRVFLCTGRSMPIIGKDILEIGFDGVIASGGGHVETEGKVLFDHVLSEETIQECLSVFHGQGMYCRIEGAEGIYTDPQMEELLQKEPSDAVSVELIRMEKELEAGIHIQLYERYPRKGAYKICFTATGMEAVKKTEKQLGDRFVYAVYPYRNSPVCLNGEIIPKEIGKGKGIELICKHYGTDLADTVAFGDGMNDYEMMETAGCSIAMGNACDEIKRVADHVCRSVQEDGIYHAFKDMGLM